MVWFGVILNFARSSGDGTGDVLYRQPLLLKCGELMTTYKKHLYMTVFPVNSLIASQLEPAAFGEHYAVGSSKYYSGKTIFVEVDIDFRDPYFDIDGALAETVPHADTGLPKRTKFICSYGVLVHVPFSALRDLYLVTINGKVLPLQKQPYTVVNQPGMIRMYQEICPLESFVASTKDQREFGKFITRETKSKGAPKIVFTQVDFNIHEFFEQNKGRDIHVCQIPNVNPYRVRDCINELASHPEKLTKTISLGSVLKDVSYRLVRHGVWFVDGDEMIFYGMPSIEELENNYYGWWKVA